jgi:hypothetical protein
LNAKQRTRTRAKKNMEMLGIARKPIENEDDVKPMDIGQMDVECVHCGALWFPGERMVRFLKFFEIL